MENQECLECQGHQVCQESQEPLETLDPLVHPDRRDLRECLDQMESENQGWTVHQGNQDRRAAKDNQVHQGCQGNQDFQELANQDTKDPKEIRGREVSQVQLAQRETEEQEVYQDHWAHPGQTDPPDYRAAWAHREG